MAGVHIEADSHVFQSGTRGGIHEHGGIHPDKDTGGRADCRQPPTRAGHRALSRAPAAHRGGTRSRSATPRAEHPLRQGSRCCRARWPPATGSWLCSWTRNGRDTVEAGPRSCPACPATWPRSAAACSRVGPPEGRREEPSRGSEPLDRPSRPPNPALRWCTPRRGASAPPFGGPRPRDQRVHEQRRGHLRTPRRRAR